jgi:hypothetical protein
MGVRRYRPTYKAVDRGRSVLAAIARREWLLQMLALGVAAGARRESGLEANDAWEAVESRIEAHDPPDPMRVHDRQVQRVAGRQANGSEHNGLGSLDDCAINRKDLIDDTEQGVERRLDRVTAVDGDVAMQNLLEDLRVRHETLASRDRLFQESLCVGLVGVRRPHEIHRNV